LQKVERAFTELRKTRESKPDPRKSEKTMIKAGQGLKMHVGNRRKGERKCKWKEALT